MTAAKHTPGPWSREWIYGGIRHLNKNVDDDAFLWDGSDERKAIEAGRLHYPNVRINEADADLIAAAPDLLAACETGLEALIGLWRSEFESRGNPTPEDKDHAVAHLRAAIAKARGES